MLQPTGQRIEGIAYPLPPGERVRWQGKPELRPLAWRAFHVRTLLFWFGLLLVWQATGAVGTDRPVARLTGAVVFLGVMAAFGALVGLFIAWSSRSTTIYAITDRRVVMKVGIVLSSTINIPFRQIQGVALRKHRDGTGDLCLELPPTDRIAYFQLWPHARPWFFNHPQPALRCLRDPDAVAQLLGDALRASLAPDEAEGASTGPETGADTAPGTWAAAPTPAPRAL